MSLYSDDAEPMDQEQLTEIIALLDDESLDVEYRYHLIDYLVRLFFLHQDYSVNDEIHSRDKFTTMVKDFFAVLMRHMNEREKFEKALRISIDIFRIDFPEEALKFAVGKWELNAKKQKILVDNSPVYKFVKLIIDTIEFKKSRIVLFSHFIAVSCHGVAYNPSCDPDKRKHLLKQLKELTHLLVRDCNICYCLEKRLMTNSQMHSDDYDKEVCYHADAAPFIEEVINLVDHEMFKKAKKSFKANRIVH